MQWNHLGSVQPDDPMLAGLRAPPVGVLRALAPRRPADAGDVAATCEYGGTLNAAFRRDNVFATQFHPEKSGAAGLALLGNFAALVATGAALAPLTRRA